MSKLAFTVQDEERAEIVFAASRDDAYHSEIGGAGEYGVQVSRSEWADSYAPGPVPKMAMLENGWWLECHGCECRIDSDLLAEVYDDDGNELEPRPLSPVERGSAIFCTAECMGSHDESRRQMKAREAQSLEYMRALTLSKMPGATLTGRDHVYVNHNKAGDLECFQVHVGFTFPGCKIGDAQYNYEGEGGYRGGDGVPHAMVCAGDKAAFEAWRDAGYGDLPATVTATQDDA